MALQGTLKDFGLADIFQLIAIQRKTGVLILRRDGDEVRVCFLKGLVVSADSSARKLEDRMGVLLLKTGKISRGQLEEALRIQAATLRKLGHILLAERMITDSDLRDVLQVQTTQLIYRLFRWRDGTYEFTQDESIDYDHEHFSPIGAETLLMEGARMIDEWPIIERQIPSFQMVFRRTAAGSSLLSSAAKGAAGTSEGGVAVEPALAAEEVTVLRLLDGKTTVEDLIDRSLLGEFEACHILHDLVGRGMVEEAGTTLAAPAPGAARPARRSLPRAIGAWLIPILSLAAVATIPWNPIAPGGTGLGLAEGELARSQSRSRLARIDLALRAHYLERQSLPDRLEGLVAAGLLASEDLVDPWGRGYDYRLLADRYELAGAGPGGDLDPDLLVVSRFHPAQRAVLSGAASAEP